MNPNSTTQIALDCEALTQLIPEYAFGLTDDEETFLVESNLDRCPEAAALLDDYRALQNELRESVAQVDPSPELGARLMAAVALGGGVTQEDEAASESADARDKVVAAEAAFEKALTDSTPDVQTETQTLPMHERIPPRQLPRQTPLRSRFYVAWVAVAAALIALVLTNVYWFSRVNDLSERLDVMAAANNANNAFVLTDTSALHWVRLAGTQDDVNASAFMMWNADSKTGLLYARGFPELPPGELYHLWLTRDGERVFAGVFQVDPDGDGALLFRSPEPINSFTNAGITAEMQTDTSATPNGTPSTPVPPSPPIVSGEL